jgi:probable phosphoglycerate mutase
MNIYITRHGKTIWNTEKRLQGRKDSPLVEEGKQNAKALKQYIKDIPFDCVYSSPTARSYDTAKLITDLPIVKDNRLIEMNFGIFEGERIKDVLEKHYDIYNNMWNHPERFDRIPEGESYDEVLMRIKSFLDDLKQKNYNNVLIVTHGMLFINMIAYMKKLERKDYVTINQRVIDGCSLTLFIEENNEYKEEYIGKNEFLPFISNEVFNK